MDKSYKQNSTAVENMREIPQQLDKLDNRTEEAIILLGTLTQTLANVLPTETKASGEKIDRNIPLIVSEYGSRLERVNYQLSLINEALQTIISNVQV